MKNKFLAILFLLAGTAALLYGGVGTLYRGKFVDGGYSPAFVGDGSGLTNLLVGGATNGILMLNGVGTNTTLTTVTAYGNQYRTNALYVGANGVVASNAIGGIELGNYTALFTDSGDDVSITKSGAGLVINSPDSPFTVPITLNNGGVTADGFTAGGSGFTGLGRNLTNNLAATNLYQFVNLEQLQSLAAGNEVYYFNTRSNNATAVVLDAAANSTNWAYSTAPALWTNVAATSANGTYAAAFVTADTFTHLSAGIGTVEIFCYEDQPGAGAITAEFYVYDTVTTAIVHEFTPAPAYQTVPAGGTPTKLTFSVPVTDYITNSAFRVVVKIKVSESSTPDPTIRIVSGGEYHSHMMFSQPGSAYARLAGANVFTASNNISGSFTGNGAGLTNIPKAGVSGLNDSLTYLTNNIGTNWVNNGASVNGYDQDGVLHIIMDTERVTLGHAGTNYFTASMAGGKTEIGSPDGVSSRMTFSNNATAYLVGGLVTTGLVNVATINATTVNSTTGNITNQTSEVITTTDFYTGTTNASFTSTDANGKLHAGTNVNAATANITNANVTLAYITNAVFLNPIVGDGSSLTNQIKTLGITVDGGGSAIATGIKGYIEVPYACRITQATLMADQVGNIGVNVWRTNSTGYPPSAVGKISAAASPVLTATNWMRDATLTGWTTSLNANDFLGFNVESNATITRVTLQLKVVTE